MVSWHGSGNNNRANAGVVASAARVLHLSDGRDMNGNKGVAAIIFAGPLNMCRYGIFPALPSVAHIPWHISHFPVPPGMLCLSVHTALHFRAGRQSAHRTGSRRKTTALLLLRKISFDSCQLPSTRLLSWVSAVCVVVDQFKLVNVVDVCACNAFRASHRGSWYPQPDRRNEPVTAFFS